MLVFSTLSLVAGGQRGCFQNQEVYPQSEVDAPATPRLSAVRLLLLYIVFRAYYLHGLSTPPSNLDQASISPHTNRGPVYDEAYLNELKASTPSSRPRLPEGDTHNDGTPTHSELGDSAMEFLDTIDTGDRLHIPLFLAVY
jgi:hypothetical protein